MPVQLLIFFAVASLIVALSSLSVSVFTMVRNGKWRDSDEAKAMLGRIDGAEDRLTRVETKLANLATKADIAKLEAQFHGLEGVVRSEIGSVRGGVDAMKEQVGEMRRWLMQEGKS